MVCDWELWIEYENERIFFRNNCFNFVVFIRLGVFFYVLGVSCRYKIQFKCILIHYRSRFPAVPFILQIIVSNSQFISSVFELTNELEAYILSFDWIDASIVLSNRSQKILCKYLFVTCKFQFLEKITQVLANLRHTFLVSSQGNTYDLIH